MLYTLLQEHSEQDGTILFTTHDLESAVRRSDRIALLHNGRVAYQKATANLEQESIRQVYEEVIR